MSGRGRASPTWRHPGRLRADAGRLAARRQHAVRSRHRRAGDGRRPSPTSAGRPGRAPTALPSTPRFATPTDSTSTASHPARQPRRRLRQRQGRRLGRDLQDRARQPADQRSVKARRPTSEQSRKPTEQGLHSTWGASHAPGITCECVPYFGAMRSWRGVQASGVAGFSAAGTVVAHAGPQGLADGRWIAIALAGAAVAAAAIASALGVALALDRRAAALHVGAAPTRLAHVVDAPPFSALVAVMLVCQGSAHAALLAAGVPAATGPVPSPVLHVVLAIGGALVAWALQRLVLRSARRLARALAAVLPRYLWPSGGIPSGTTAPLRARPRAGGHRGRAPPLTVASAMVIAST